MYLLELAFRYFPTGITIIGVTGTNGKTTTTTLIYEFLKKASKSVFLMGNIGYPVCFFVPQLKVNEIFTKIGILKGNDLYFCVITFFTIFLELLYCIQTVIY